MKIGVIADTHIPRSAKSIPSEVFEIFRGVDLILHAGDLTEEDAIKQLEVIAPVIAVHGNRDSEKVGEMLTGSKRLELQGFKVGLIHGHGDKGTTMQRMPDFFKGENLDLIVFGHSHIPFNETINNTLYFNPGSPTVKKRQKAPSVGILEIGEAIKGEIIYLKQEPVQKK